MNDIRCKARVLVTLEIDAGSTWGADCVFEQVYKQACQGAIGRIERGLRPTDMRIVGEMKVTAIITTDP